MQYSTSGSTRSTHPPESIKKILRQSNSLSHTHKRDLQGASRRHRLLSRREGYNNLQVVRGVTGGVGVAWLFKQTRKINKTALLHPPIHRPTKKKVFFLFFSYKKKASVGGNIQTRMETNKRNGTADSRTTARLVPSAHWCPGCSRAVAYDVDR